MGTPRRTSDRLPFDPDYYEGNPEIDIYSWCPTPTPTVPPTQVHMHADALEGRVRKRK